MTPYRPILLGLLLSVPALGLAEAPADAAPAAAKTHRAETARPGAPAPGRAGVGARKDGKTPPESKAAAPIPPPQPVDPADARAATESAVAYLDALKDGGFAAAPAHLHPQALERFKTLVMPRLDQEEARGTRRLLNATFGRDASFATARSADPADFMARFVRVVMARDPQAAPRFATLTPLGVVAEGERLHVLVRLGGSAGADGAGGLQVISLLPDGKTWKALLDGRLEDVARALGGPARSDDRRAGFPRLEPMPEGAAALPAGPPGLGGLPALPEMPPTPRAVR